MVRISDTDYYETLWVYIMKITIVGGGTAGWIAAFFICKAQPNNHEITVVESSSIGIVGAGEGSTGIFADLLNGYFFNYKVDINKFIEETNSTPKLGIRHINWTGDNSQYFAPLDGSDTAFQLNDFMFKYVLAEYGKDKIHYASRQGLQYEYRHKDNSSALHFDAFKVGAFFKKECLKDGVVFVDSIVKDVTIDNNNHIKSIVLENNAQLFGDLFIDCTGFARVLSKKLNINWVSYKDILPMNTAMPFLLDHDNNSNIRPETKATAMSSGWMWDIPLTTRKGCGYVFDKNFLSETQAQKEIELYLGKQITPIRFLEFEAGHLEQFWKNNLLSLGLSSSFVEPLEASSIHNTIVQVAIFVKEFLLKNKEDTITKTNENIYNKRITFLNKLTIDFISLHYQGGREDSNFWRHIKTNQIMSENTKELLQKAKGKIPGFVMQEGMWGSYSIPLANYILAGLNIITSEQAKRDLIDDEIYHQAKNMYRGFHSNYRNYLQNLQGSDTRAFDP